MTFRWVLLPVLLSASAFFSGSEVAFFSLTRLQVEKLGRERGLMGERVAALLSDPQKLLVTLYIANELVNVAISSVMTFLALELFGDAGVALALGAGVFALLVFGEITPKTFAHYSNEKWALLSSVPLTVFMWVISPVQIVVTWLAAGIASWFGGKASSASSMLTEDEIKTLMEKSANEGVIDEGEREMIRSVFDLGDLTVREVMTPRTEILALDVSTPLVEAWGKMAESSFARAPVFHGAIDNIEGVLFKKDLLKLSHPPDPAVTLKSLLREPFIVPETMTINELLREFKKRKSHMAVAMDEYGGVQGVITLDDIISELIGVNPSQIREQGHDVKRAGADTYIIQASMPLEDFSERFNTNLEHEELETIGGYVFHLFGRVPATGESVEAEGLTFTVERLKGRRITELRMKAPGHNGGHEGEE